VSNTGTLAVQAAVGLLSGGAGALIGATAQRRLEDHRYARERRAALWQLVRALKQTSDKFTDDRSYIEPHAALEPAKAAAARYLHTLPRELQDKLEAEVPNRRNDIYEVGEGLWGQAKALEQYLEHSEPKDERQG
jgi:hypothetical protein